RGNEVLALIRAGNGIVYKVKKGEYLGQNHGRVIEISQTEIVVREIVSDGIGGWLARPAALAMSH
ncbi:MAG: pilus assembly protein PilP, partial [Gammaproteobacteria bacterium]|nr:pilus assembly protein PilP [Gammaproteobacteria bacterium]